MGCEQIHAPSISPQRWDPPSDPPVSKVPGCTMSSVDQPSAGHHGGPSPPNPTPQSCRPQTGRCRIKHFHLTSSAASEIYRCYTSLGFPLLGPFTYPAQLASPPNSTLPQKLPSGPYHFGGREEPFQRCSNAPPF